MENKMETAILKGYIGIIYKVNIGVLNRRLLASSCRLKDFSGELLRKVSRVKALKTHGKIQSCLELNLRIPHLEGHGI